MAVNFYIKQGFTNNCKIIDISGGIIQLKYKIYLDDIIYRQNLLSQGIRKFGNLFTYGLESIIVSCDQIIIIKKHNTKFRVLIGVVVEFLYSVFVDCVWDLMQEEKLLCSGHISYKYSIKELYILNIIRNQIDVELSEILTKHGGYIMLKHISSNNKEIHIKITGSCNGCYLKNKILLKQVKTIINNIIPYYNILEV